MTTTRGDNIYLTPKNTASGDDQDDLNLKGHDDDTGDSTAWANVLATGGGAGTNGPTNFNLRVEQNKIPEFFGAKSKDIISKYRSLYLYNPMER